MKHSGEMFIRYPGSKAKLWRHIVAFMPDNVSVGQLYSRSLTTYCEPFFGSGAIGWKVMRRLAPKNARVVINDLDIGMSSLWSVVLNRPCELIALTDRYTPSSEDFYLFKSRDGDPGINQLQRAFEKLVLHQTSFSGLGVKAGGPLGGRSGRSEYNVHCRWSAARISSGISHAHRTLSAMASVDICNSDFEPVLSALDSAAFAYLDPPYFVQGPNLYKHGMSSNDHTRLRDAVRHAEYSWVLSYDDCEEIRDLYSSWARVQSFEMVPTIQTARTSTRRKNRELLIANQSRPLFVAAS